MTTTTDAAASLRAVLDDIAAGELVCHPATRHRLEGAWLALEQLTDAGQLPAPRLSNDRL